ncbi:glycosyltransferase family 4 protein, partial [[Eubacterium] cellulosolvens]
MVHHDLNPPFFEAVRRLGFELCRELAKQGHEVHVVTGFVKKEDSFPVEIEGVSFHRIPQSSFSRALPERLRRLHEEEKLHIIHFQNTLLSKRFIRPLSLIVRRIQVPTVAYMCMQPVVPLREFVRFARLGSMGDELSLDPGYYIAGLLASRLLVRTEFNLVRHVVASSDYIRNQLVRIGVPREKTEVVYPYVDIDRFIGTIDRDPRV